MLRPASRSVTSHRTRFSWSLLLSCSFVRIEEGEEMPSSRLGRSLAGPRKGRLGPLDLCLPWTTHSSRACNMTPSIYPDLPDIAVRLDSGGVAVVILDRPAQRNAFTNPMKDSLVRPPRAPPTTCSPSTQVEAFRRLDADDAVKVVVLQGAPNPGNAFCAGADLSKGDFSNKGRFSHNAASNLNEHRDGGGQTSLAALRIRKPTICAINGHGVGIGKSWLLLVRMGADRTVGITMTLGFDIRLAWKDAKIGFVFAKRGIVPEGTSCSPPPLFTH